jgi:hypothetical protein
VSQVVVKRAVGAGVSASNDGGSGCKLPLEVVCGLLTLLTSALKASNSLSSSVRAHELLYFAHVFMT